MGVRLHGNKTDYVMTGDKRLPKIALITGARDAPLAYGLDPKTEKSPFWPMGVALMMAEKAKQCGEVPVGAVLVQDNRIIARAHNQMNGLKNPMAHAEILVLVQAMAVLSSKYLNDCHLYVTLQPCAFCVQALILARIGRVYFGAYDTSLPAPESFERIGGVCEQRCQSILHEFFHQKR
jgi:tRNA(adenine34) deaminase